MSAPQILVIGAAGYIGGTIVHDLLKTQNPSTITALVRTPEKQTLLEPLKIKTVLGAVDDLELLKSLATRHDVVINVAVAFGGDEASVQALVDGLAARAKATATKPVYLHTGGSGTVLYGSDGIAGTDVWTDEQYDRWSSLPDGSFFYGGYKIVAAAALRGDISAYIILSPTVYGKGLGLGNTLSLQIPAYVKYAKTKGRAAYIGKGENIWGNVHVQDLSQLYITVFKYALANPDETTASAASNGFENLIYSGTGEHSWGPVVKELGNLLYARGEIKEPSAKEIGEGEGILYMFGGNSFLAPSYKAKALGFTAEQKDLVGAMQEALAR